MAATAPGTHLSHWAATRVFDRLEGFGKVRELSVHASAIRASQAPTWRGAPALSEFKAMVLTAIAYFQSITRSELPKISGKEVSRDTIASRARQLPHLRPAQPDVGRAVQASQP